MPTHIIEQLSLNHQFIKQKQIKYGELKEGIATVDKYIKAVILFRFSTQPIVVRKSLALYLFVIQIIL